jgi:hypothetical protein
MRRLTAALVLAIGLTFATSACLVHTHGRTRHGKSCPKNKVWVEHNGKWKCKHKNFKRGHKKQKHDKGHKVKKRDHRD